MEKLELLKEAWYNAFKIGRIYNEYEAIINTVYVAHVPKNKRHNVRASVHNSLEYDSILLHSFLSQLLHSELFSLSLTS